LYRVNGALKYSHLPTYLSENQARTQGIYTQKLPKLSLTTDGEEYAANLVNVNTWLKKVQQCSLLRGVSMPA